MNIQPKPAEPLILSGRDVTAVLGPTNTGKTHLAIERMVAHESGVIGLPLRLLAREVYARVCEKIGSAKVALVTGEEKIQPPGAKYFVCTVEATPRETDAAFVALDEVQLAGDLERGHIFTDRILHLRGRQETLLLGAATMQGILQKLLRGVSVVTRPRLSHLAYAGSKKLTRLPRRTAIVAFSADEVYAIAELIRRQQGGAAVVLGALSPRTRNAQVALYQSGDVDYLIATDAIGMGLNLDVDHVAFAQNRKFDGFQYRQLTAAELGQIAGRAGRHLRDGTFGVTGQVDPFDEELIQKIESHDFEPVKVLQWRTAAFDFASLDALKRSIETNAPVEGLTRALPAVDAQALEYLSRDGEIRALAKTRERVALLWEACALPDYRRIAPAQHADLIASIYTDLARDGHVDENYMAEQVRRADATEGDIDTLSHRIAQIRTWTFVSNRPGWLADPAHWQEKTREIEDRLSDALHERLTKRFVDRRTSVLMRRLRENTMLDAEIDATGTVLVEGHHVGELQGFRFTADQSAGGEDAKAVKAAAQKALGAEFEARAERFGHLQLKGALVVLLAAEGHRERGEPFGRHRCRQCRHDGGIEAPGKIGADRHIRPHADACRIGEQAAQLFRRRARIGVLRRRVRVGILQCPVRPDRHAVSVCCQAVGGLQLENVAEGRARRDRSPQGEDLVERKQVHPRLDAGHPQQRLHFGGEIQRAAHRGVEQRPNAHPVAGDHQALFLGIPDRKGKVAVQPGQAVGAHALVKMQDDFGVAPRSENVTLRFQGVTQLDIVEDLAVEDDREAPVGVGHRLLAVAKSDDRQARMS